MLYLNDAHAGRADRDDVDLVRLELRRHRERQVRQQNPGIVAIVAGCRLETDLEMFERLAFTLVGGRSARKMDDFHDCRRLMTMKRPS